MKTTTISKPYSTFSFTREEIEALEKVYELLGSITTIMEENNYTNFRGEYETIPEYEILEAEDIIGRLSALTNGTIE